MAAFTIAFLALTLLWLMYWTMVRPVILDGVEYELQALKTRVDWSILEGLPDAESRPASELAQELRDSISIRHISLGLILCVLIRHRPQMKAKLSKEREVFHECPAWIREIRNRNLELSTKAALVNSPLWWIPISFLLLMAYFSMKISNWWTDAQITASLVRSGHATA